MEDELYLLNSLDDITISTMTIVEGTENKRPGVLCEVEGPFIVLSENNNNDRWYTASLVDNKILGIPYTKKMLKNKTLYGEASHPHDRFDVKLPFISHNITDLWYNSDKTILMGRADVLDTPSGRIIYTLIQYGSKIGISVRARGRLLNKGGKTIPDESVYKFKTFDFVPNPGFDEARMNRVDESVVDDNIATSFLKYVNEASISDLSCIQSIFESANEDVFGDVKRAIQERMSENTLIHDDSDSSVAEVLYEEAVKNDEYILELEDQITCLKGKLDESERAKDILCEKVSTLEYNVRQKTEDIENMRHRFDTLNESEDALRLEGDKLRKRVLLVTGKLKELRVENEVLSSRLDESEKVIDNLERENLDVLERLEENQNLPDFEPFSLQGIKSDVTKKKRSLPQGKSQVLNESMVDKPIVTDRVVNDSSSRRQRFISKCLF